jgi:hypothetical protein
MNDTGRLFQAFVAPAIFVSATALLVLSINVRLMGMVSRLRQSVCAHFAGCFDHVLSATRPRVVPERSCTCSGYCFRRSMISLLIGTLFYIREIMVALSSVHSEARDLNFMDLATPPEIRGRDAL